MNEPVYLRPRELAEAVLALAERGEKARILAGGTDLLIAMRRGTVRPEAILDISCLDELRGIRREDDFVHIGSLATHGEIRHSPELARWAPSLVDACREVGSVQIRNLGTLGGNLGNASPAGDTIPVLYILDAEVHLLSLTGDHWLPIANFFTGPGKSVRRPDEIITGVRFRPFDGMWKDFFQKIGQRRALRVAKVSAAGGICLDSDRVLDCRLALGAVAPTVIRLQQAEESLIGSQLTGDGIRRAAQHAAQACTPINDIRSTIDYRRAMAGVLIRQGLEKIYNEVKYG
jgi:CO/xanthine dehydrogenase FAD-binding subunit